MAIARIDSNSAASGGAPLSGVASLNASGASILIAVLAEFNSGTPSVVTDSNGNTWTPLTASTSTSPYIIRISYAKNPTATNGMTFSTDLGTYPALIVVAYSGIDTTAPYDSTAGQSVETYLGSAQNQLGSLTPTTSGSLFITGIVGTVPSTGVFSIDSGFTIPTRGDVAGALNGVLADFFPSAGAKSPIWSGNPADSAATMAVFAPGSGGSGGGAQPASSSLPLVGVQ